MARLLLAALVLAAGCRDYQALSRGRDLAVSDLSVNDLAMSEDLRVASDGGADDLGGVCGRPDLALGPSFTPVLTASSVLTADSPGGLAVGDLNGDQKLDVAISLPGATGTTKIVQTLLGPDLTTGRSWATGGVPDNVAVADLDGDHHPDLITVDDQGKSLSILAGEGGGLFAPEIPIAVSTVSSTPVAYPSVVAGDFNEDGTLDLAVSVPGQNKVYVLIASGRFAYKTPVGVSVGSGPSFLLARDLDGDCHLDLAVADYGAAGVNVLLGAGDGTFSIAGSLVTTTQPTSIAAADFNRDGRIDLAVGSSSSNRVSIFYGQPNGLFGAATSLTINSATTPSYASLLAAADFNGDGAPDLAVLDVPLKTLFLFLDDGLGNFTQTTAGAANAARNLIAVDFDGNGRMGLAYTRAGAPNELDLESQ